MTNERARGIVDSGDPPVAEDDSDAAPEFEPAEDEATGDLAADDAAPTAEVGFLDFVDNPFRRHLEQRPGDRIVTTNPDVVVNIAGIDFAKMAQGDSCLVLVERDIGVPGNGLVGLEIVVHQALNYLIAPDRLLNDLSDIGRAHFGIENLSRLQGHQG